jgi:predicted dehydrogenase
VDLLTGGKLPTSLSAVGVKHFDQSVENLAYVHLTYPGNFVAHLHLNWTAPLKLRTVMVGGTKKMAVYDENLPTERVKIYDKGLSLQHSGTPYDFRVSYRTGDMVAPAISNKEALAGMIAAFITTVTEGKPSVSSGASGKRVVQILEAASLSMAEGGRPVEVGGPSKVERRLKVA